jgi:hypothetical protein
MDLLGIYHTLLCITDGRISFAPLLFLHYCHFLGAGLTILLFYFLFFLLLLREASTVTTRHDTKKPLLYTTTPPNFTTLDDKIPKERLFEWATTRL